MSFDVFLQYAQRETPRDAVAKVDQVVRAFGGGARQEAGYFFDLSDDGAIELFLEADGDNAMLALRSLTPETVRFIRETMKATGWVLLTADDDACAALSAIPSEDVQEGFPGIKIVTTDADIEAFLQGGFDGWADYRDQVVKG